MGVIVDTSVWIDHLHKRDEVLAGLLTEGVVLVHEHIIGELAAGSIPNRQDMLRMLQDLGCAPTASLSACLALLDEHSLHGLGLSWIDIHLLTSAQQHGHRLQTRDKRLNRYAQNLGVA